MRSIRTLEVLAPRGRPYSTKELTDAFTYCVQVVRTRDFENYVWCTQLPKAVRPGVFALRAFHVETASVQERAGEGALFAQMRFQWWLDAISNLYKGQLAANPIFRALACVMEKRHLTRYRLKKVVETRLSDALREEPLQTMADLETYADGTAAQVMQLQVTYRCRDSWCDGRVQLEAAGVEEDDEAAYRAAQLIGRGIGLTNVLRGTAFHAQKRRLYFPADTLRDFQARVRYD